MTGPRRRRLALNGKWLGQELTGTQRYAREVTRHLLPLLADRPVLHVPARAVVPGWLKEGAEVRRSRASGTVFEQVALPWAARRDLLVSLGGAAPLLARRQVATMHDATPFRLPETYSRAFRTWYRLMYRVVSRRASLIVTVSEFSRRDLSDVLGVDPARVVVVPNGVDHMEGRDDDAAPDLPDLPAGAPEGPFVLMVGPPAVHKNIAPVASALARRGVAVVVVGGGSPRVFGVTAGGEASDALAPSGVAGHAQGRVQHLGRVSDTELAALYRQASALVFPSLYEGFGLPVVEAQRLGCLVVAADRTSLPEVAGNGALLVDPTSPDDIARQVVDLLADPARAAGLRDAGLTNARRFSWDASAAVLAAMLADHLGDRVLTAPGRPGVKRHQGFSGSK